MRKNWRDDAACRRHNPELFVPQERNAPSGPIITDTNIREALAVCAECPVIDDCREFADSITDVPMTGVWGHQYRSRKRAVKRQQLAGVGPYDAVTS